MSKHQARRIILGFGCLIILHFFSPLLLCNR